MDTKELDTHSLISVSDLLNQSWEMFRKRFFSFLKITLFQLLLTTLMILLVVLGYFLYTLFPYNLFYLVTYFIVALGLFILLYYFELRIQISLMYVPASDEPQNFMEYFNLSKGKVISFFWLTFLQGLIVFGGTMLFIVPGMLIAIGLAFSSWVYIIEGKKGLSAIQQSRKYAHGRLLGIFGRGLLLGLILGAITGAASYVTVGSNVAYIIITLIVSFIASGFSICFSYLLYKSAAETSYEGYEPKLWHMRTVLAIGVIGILTITTAALFLIFKHFLK